MTKKLTKSRKNKMIDGVCGGVAEYFNIDPTIIRLIVVAICFLKGVGVLIYVVAAIVMPYGDDVDFYDESENIDNLKSANVDDESDKKKSSKKEKNNGKKEVPHTDEEFEKFFQK